MIELRKIKKVIVAGPRDYHNYEIVSKNILNIFDMYPQTQFEIFEGGARGVDACAKRFAISEIYSHEQFKADWDKYGRSAGPIRNSEMAMNADMLIAFRYKDKCSRGTENMIKTALNHSLEIHIIPIDRE